MFEKLSIPQELHGLVGGVMGLLPTAMLARFLYHHRLVTLGHRKFWSREFIWEIPTAVLSAIIGGGIAAYWHLEPMAAQAVVGFCAWLGPRGMEVALARIVDRYTGKKKGE